MGRHLFPLSTVNTLEIFGEIGGHISCRKAVLALLVTEDWLIARANRQCADPTIRIYWELTPQIAIFCSSLAVSFSVPTIMEKEKKETQNGRNLLPGLLCCMLVACVALVFAVYSHMELSAQIREHDKLIQALQLHNSARDVQVRYFFPFDTKENQIFDLSKTFSQ